MNWEKKGLIYEPLYDGSWKDNSALTPTPILINENTIRVYCGFRDVTGVSRIGYADLDIEDPTKIIRVSDKPVLDIGRPGNFDDNGVILGDVILKNGVIYMYYVGFQLVEKVKFLAFTGLALSEDGGETFHRHKESPILDRQNNSLCFNAVHSIIFENDKFKCWLGAGSGWQKINDNYYPSYNVKYIESENGIIFNDVSTDCIVFENDNEYRVGRPRVWKNDNGYEMIFTWGDKQGNYQMGYANSPNGIDWERNDKELNFYPSEEGWDSQWISYGAPINVNNTTYMFYNGNDMGKEGFGLAILKKN